MLRDVFAFGLRGIRAVDAVASETISSPKCITGQPLLSPLDFQGLLLGRFLPIFTDFSDFLGRLQPSKTTKVI